MLRQLLYKLIIQKQPEIRNAKLGPVLAALQQGATVLDVGVCTDIPEHHPAENWLQKQPCGEGRMIAASPADMRPFHRLYPDVLCVQADGAALPFRDNSVDVAMANAVLEHVVPERQAAFAGELARVVRRWAFLAVPDRWAPIEVHTQLPFIHWLPFWRKAMVWTGQGMWSTPDALNMFTRRTLRRVLNASGTGAWRVWRQTLFGVPVSILARFEKRTT